MNVNVNGGHALSDRRKGADRAQTDTMELVIEAKSQNESFARVAVAAFCTRLDPTLEEITDIKTAVSEAVTNCIVHGYEGRAGKIYITAAISGQMVEIVVKDRGCGIEDIGQALQPLYTSKPELERSGMGFSFMEAFMDELEVESAKDKGTTVTMRKVIREAIGE